MSASIYRKMLNAFYRGVHCGRLWRQGGQHGLGPYTASRLAGIAPAPLTFLRKLLCLKGSTNNLHARKCPVKAHLDIAGDHPIDTRRPAYERDQPERVATPDFKNCRKTVRAAERHHTV